jgi:hypothetical protein
MFLSSLSSLFMQTHAARERGAARAACAPLRAASMIPPPKNASNRVSSQPSVRSISEGPQIRQTVVPEQRALIRAPQSSGKQVRPTKLVPDRSCQNWSQTAYASERPVSRAPSPRSPPMFARSLHPRAQARPPVAQSASSASEHRSAPSAATSEASSERASATSAASSEHLSAPSAATSERLIRAPLIHLSSLRRAPMLQLTAPEFTPQTRPPVLSAPSERLSATSAASAATPEHLSATPAATSEASSERPIRAERPIERPPPPPPQPQSNWFSPDAPMTVPITHSTRARSCLPQLLHPPPSFSGDTYSCSFSSGRMAPHHQAAGPCRSRRRVHVPRAFLLAQGSVLVHE